MDLSRLSVLVAEPSPYMIKIFRAMLRGFGIARIFEAQDGANALEIFKTQIVDIAIIDYNLTTLTGVELTELLRGDEKSANRFTPIIMVSAYTEKWRVEQCRDAGINEFLLKPLCARDMYDRMQEIIKNPRPFVRSGTYFGPDRRRQDSTTYTGKERRADEPALEEGIEGGGEESNQDDIDALFG